MGCAFFFPTFISASFFGGVRNICPMMVRTRMSPTCRPLTTGWQKNLLYGFCRESKWAIPRERLSGRTDGQDCLNSYRAGDRKTSIGLPSPSPQSNQLSSRSSIKKVVGTSWWGTYFRVQDRWESRPPFPNLITMGNGPALLILNETFQRENATSRSF